MPKGVYLRNKKRPPISEEHKERIREYNRTRIISRETRALMSSKKKGIKLSDEHKRKIGAASSLRGHTEETKRKLSELRMGDKNPAWRGGIKIDTPAGIIRSSREYDRWRKACLLRDDYTCKISGIRGGDMEVHHINNFADFPEYRLDINNGITLRKEIHNLFHKKYGNHNNTREQLDEFIKDYADTNKINISGGAEQNTGGEITETCRCTEVGARVKS
ncbi:HNH endonuclease [bacterium]|nr:HNH endonuclease [bacterium]